MAALLLPLARVIGLCCSCVDTADRISGVWRQHHQ
eukprot:COSAG06_NODE_61225_length_268_cov_0.751479_1_plen_34_part_01